MKAVVFHEFGSSDVVQIEELPDPTADPGEVVIDVAASALNHLDVDVREGVSRFPVDLPHVLGIEPVGRISELGDGVDGWQVGDRVALYLIATCGNCLYCRSGRESLAGYKVPRQVVPVDAVVRSPSGKPDYRWARDAALGNSLAD